MSFIIISNEIIFGIVFNRSNSEVIDVGFESIEPSTQTSQSQRLSTVQNQSNAVTMQSNANQLHQVTPPPNAVLNSVAVHQPPQLHSGAVQSYQPLHPSQPPPPPPPSTHVNYGHYPMHSHYNYDAYSNFNYN